MQDSKEIEKKTPFEPRFKHLEFDEASAQGIILDFLLTKMALGELFVQRINNTPIFDTNTGRHRSMPKGSHKGFPDILVIKDGRIIFFEVKSATGYQSKDQVQMQNNLEMQRAEYYIVRTLTYVVKALDLDPHSFYPSD